MKENRQTRVALVLIEEATASTLLSIYDVFNLVHRVIPGERAYSVTLVGENAAEVVTASGIALRPQATLDEVPVCDIVIVPSLLLRDDAWPKGRHEALMLWLRRQYAQGALLCSACTGVFPLLETGLFDGLPVTCHWHYAGVLRDSFPQADIRIDRTLLVSGAEQRFIMSGASASWHDLVLFLVSRFSGPAAATTLARFFLLGWHPEGQAPYMRFREDTGHADACILQAQAWARQHWMQPGPVEEMARLSGLPERSFVRRFKKATGLAPLDYVQHIRIEQARQLLENTDLPVDTIAADTGYEDPAFFRKLFKRITTMTPSAYRLKFRPSYRQSA